MPSRRTFLAAVGAGCAAGLAGCTGLRQSIRRLRFGEPERRVEPGWRPGEGEWSVRGGPRRTGYSPHATPPRDDPEEVWQLGREAFASWGVRDVVVADGTVFLRTAESLAAVDAADGELLWEQERKGDGWIDYLDGRIYELARAEAEPSGATAMDLEGERLWSTDIDAMGWPVERDGWVYLTTMQDGMYRLHADAGEPFEHLADNSWGVSLADGTLYAGEHHWVAYDVTGGEFEETWSQEPKDEWYWTHGNTAVGEEHLFRPEKAPLVEAPPRLVIRSRDGEDRTLVEFDGEPEPPAVAEDVAFVGTSEDDGEGGELVALEADGERLWDRDQGGGVGEPVVADGVVYVGPKDGSSTPVAGYDADSGETLWELEALGQDGRSAVPAVAGETLYVADGESLRAIR